MTQIERVEAELREEVAEALFQALGGDFDRVDMPYAADAIIPLVLERAVKVAEEHRDYWQGWHMDAEQNPDGRGYCCYKTAANILGAIRALSNPVKAERDG